MELLLFLLLSNGGLTAEKAGTVLSWNDAEAVAPEVDELAQSSFTAEESAALCWLRGWYQGGGSDRMQLVRHWEFLKWLVVTGKLAQ